MHIKGGRVCGGMTFDCCADGDAVERVIRKLNIFSTINKTECDDQC